VHEAVRLKRLKLNMSRRISQSKFVTTGPRHYNCGRYACMLVIIIRLIKSDKLVH